MSNVFITGGSGFIGRALVTRLIAEGEAVRVLVRSPESARVVEALGATAVLGDLTDPAPWQDALAGQDVVFHLAAETDVTAPAERHERVTVDGTRAIVEAARSAGVPRFVHCGSEAALMTGQPLIDVDETLPLRPDSPGAYSAAKARAERIVLEAAGPDFVAVSIRPRFVWGPDSILIENLVGAARAGVFAWIDGGHHRTDVTYVDNAVEGLVLGWRRGAAGEAYFVTDQHPVDFRAFLQLLFDVHGLRETIPEVRTEVAAGTDIAPFLWFIGQECTLRTGKAERELGYRAVVDQLTGVERSADRVLRGELHAGPAAA